MANTWRSLGVFLCGFALPLLVYLESLAPDLTWAHGGADGGDLIVAAYTLGVPHPPGYPGYTLLAHLFTLFPWGSIAYRVNLLSAFSAAFAAGGVALVVLASHLHEQRGDVFVAAIVSAWGLAFAPLMWKQAVIAEVYAVHAACVAFTLWLAVLIHDKPTIAGVWILGLVYGLSFGFHLTTILLLPIVAWGLAGTGQGTASHRLILFFVGGIVLASLQWFYLPWRAGRGAFTWGNPDTLDGWWWLVSGALYRDNVFALPFEKWFERLAYFARTLLFGLGPIAVLLALIGWEKLAHHRSGWATAWAVSLIAFVIFAIGYNTADSDSYLIPGLVIFSTTVGSGMVHALGWFRARWGSKMVDGVWALLFLQPILILYLNWSSVSLSGDRDAVLFGQQLMGSAPPDAILITTEDRTTFAVWYFHYVLAQRADILTIDPGLVPYDWYRVQIGITEAEGERIVNHGLAFDSRTVCRILREGESPRIQCPALSR